MKRWLSLITLAAAAALAGYGCYHGPGYARTAVAGTTGGLMPAGAIVSTTAPPAPRETAPPPPRAGHVWASGYWSIQNGQWFWVPGHWEPAQPGNQWVPSRWEQTGGHYQLYEGHWEPAGGY